MYTYLYSMSSGRILVPTGLLHSKYFLALISAPALSKVRDAKTDHTYDNVLLEYELAIKVCADSLYSNCLNLSCQLVEVPPLSI